MSAETYTDMSAVDLMFELPSLLALTNYKAAKVSINKNSDCLCKEAITVK